MRLLQVVGATLLGVMLLITNAQAALEIDITGGINEGRRVVVLPFRTQGQVPEDVSAVISADLTRSGKFAPLTVSQLPAGAIANNGLNFDVLASIGAEAVLSGEVVATAPDSYQVIYQLYGVQGSNKGRPLMERRAVTANAQQLRQAAHLVSDRTYEAVLGQKGAFRTRIAYIVYRHGDTYKHG